MTPAEIKDLFKRIRKEGYRPTPEEKREVILKYPAKSVAASLTGSLRWNWAQGPDVAWEERRVPTDQERYDAVVAQVREVMDLVMPDEDKAREIFALMPWPSRWRRSPQGIQTEDFGPVPTFEKVMGLECATCGGTGVTGFLTGRRCFDCS